MEKISAKEIVKAVCEHFSGFKGGGNDYIAQASGPISDNIIENIIKFVKDYIEKCSV